MISSFTLLGRALNGSIHDTIDFHGGRAAENYNSRVVRRVEANLCSSALRQFGEIVSGRG